MRQDIDVTLFKGGGPVSETEKKPFFIRRDSKLLEVFAVHKLFGRTAMHSECLLYGLAMLPHLRNSAYDVVHTIDPPLTRFLFNMRQSLGLRFRLLYTEGCAMPPSDYPPADHTHHVTKVTFDDAIAYGRSASAMTLVPCGFDPGRFAVNLDRFALRRMHGIDQDVFVILSIAALNRGHKRIDYLIDEVGAIEGKVLLLLDGSRDHPDHVGLIAYAKQRLGDRCRISHVASDKVGEFYHMADVMAHAALFESFGLALAEASACGLPVVVHDAPHFRWLFPNSACWTDMSRPGALAAKLTALMADRSRLQSLVCSESTLRRFSWPHLRTHYAALYRGVANSPAVPA
jgi:glycosyltransferase involved in cell wall biosynthesis